MTIFTERLDRPDKALKAWQAAEGIELHGYSSAREAQFHISESISQGDFPVQITPAVRKTMQAVYSDVPSEASRFTTRITQQHIEVDEQYNIYDFGDQSNIPELNHGERFLVGGLPNVQNRERYPQLKMKASGKTTRLSTYGEGFGIDWQAIVNLRGANVNLIRDAAVAFGAHARGQEDVNVVNLLINAAGTGFATGDGQALENAYAVSGNPDLSDFDMLPTVISALKERTIEGHPVNYSKYILLVQPSQVVAAQRAIDTRTVTSLPARTGTGSAARGAMYDVTTPLGAEVEVVGWEWLRRAFPNIGRGWLLIPVPNSTPGSTSSLPVLTMNYLEGYEQPQMFIKDSNSRRLSGSGGVGGPISPLEGDFDQDAILTKVRHNHGASALWSEGIAFSLGTNA